MIAPLRRRHRLTVTVLALAVPVLVVLALAARSEPPIVDRLPPGLEDPAPTGEVLADYGALFTGQAVVARLLGDGSRRWIELEPREPVTRPEVLVYWTPESEGVRLGAGAVLLGALGGARPRAFALPDDAASRDGRLVLYSLGHQEVVDSAPLPSTGAPPAEAEVDTPEEEPTEPEEPS